METFGQLKGGVRYSSLLALMTRILHDISWEGDSCTGLLIKSLPVMKHREGHLAACGYGAQVGGNAL